MQRHQGLRFKAVLAFGGLVCAAALSPPASAHRLRLPAVARIAQSLEIAPYSYTHYSCRRRSAHSIVCDGIEEGTDEFGEFARWSWTTRYTLRGGLLKQQRTDRDTGISWARVPEPAEMWITAPGALGGTKRVMMVATLRSGTDGRLRPTAIQDFGSAELPDLFLPFGGVSLDPVGVRMRCADGSPHAEDTGSFGPFRGAVAPDGRFRAVSGSESEGTTPGESSVVQTLSGRFRGPRITGTLRIATIRRDGVNCTSGPVTFRLRRAALPRFVEP